MTTSSLVRFGHIKKFGIFTSFLQIQNRVYTGVLFFLEDMHLQPPTSSFHLSLSLSLSLFLFLFLSLCIPPSLHTFYLIIINYYYSYNVSIDNIVVIVRVCRTDESVNGIRSRIHVWNSGS